MNVVLAKQLHDAYKLVVMHMFYEIVLTIQLVHLNCRKGPEQPPTRKKDEMRSEEQVMTIQNSLQ